MLTKSIAKSKKMLWFKDGELSQKLDPIFTKSVTSFVFIDILADNYDTYSLAYDRTYQIE